MEGDRQLCLDAGMDGWLRGQTGASGDAVRSDRHGTGDQSVTPVVPEPNTTGREQIPVIDVDALADLESLEEQGDFSVRELIETFADEAQRD